MDNILKVVSDAMVSLEEHYMLEYGIKPDYTMNAPTTGKQIKAAFNKAKLTSLFPVYSDTSNGCIFGNRCNLAYRFVHDIDHALHYDQGKGTTATKDEKFLNCLLCNRIYCIVKAKHGECVALEAYFVLYADTVGQTINYAKTGDFVKDQAKFVVDLLERCKGYYFAKHGQVSLARQIMQAYNIDCGVTA